MSDIPCCDSCGKACLPEELVSFDGQLLCPDCLSETTLICDRCGERIWKDDNAGDSNTTLCQSCYDRWYVSCSRCGAVIHESDARYARGNDDDPLCEACYTRHHGSNAINDYYYHPEPIFYGDGPLYMGVELEIDGGGEYDSNARKLLDAVNIRDEFIYCKHDGSLDEGFEIVTHPMTLAFHQKEMPWATILEKAIAMGYTSHQARTCGLHVHVNRDAFGSTAAQQDACIARVLYIFEKFWDELLKFSRRTPRQLERWASRYGYKDHPKEILDECQELGWHEDGMAVRILREGRKFQIAGWFSTQWISSKTAAAALKQAGTQLYFRQHHDNAMEAAKALLGNMPEKVHSVLANLSSLSVGDFIMCDGHGRPQKGHVIDRSFENEERSG